MMLGTEISMFSLSLSFTSWKKQPGNVMKMWLIICVLPLIWRDFRLITWIMDLWSNWFGCCQEGIQKDLESVLLSTRPFFLLDAGRLLDCGYMRWHQIKLYLSRMKNIWQSTFLFTFCQNHFFECIRWHCLGRLWLIILKCVD